MYSQSKYGGYFQIVVTAAKALILVIVIGIGAAYFFAGGLFAFISFLILVSLFRRRGNCINLNGRLALRSRYIGNGCLRRVVVLCRMGYFKLWSSCSKKSSSVSFNAWRVKSSLIPTAF